VRRGLEEAVRCFPCPATHLPVSRVSGDTDTRHVTERAVAANGRGHWLAVLLVLLIFASPAEYDQTRGRRVNSPGGPKYWCGEPGCDKRISEAQYHDDLARGGPRHCPKHELRLMDKKMG
jgi:hypothetical protein